MVAEMPSVSWDQLLANACRTPSAENPGVVTLRTEHSWLTNPRWRTAPSTRAVCRTLPSTKRDRHPAMAWTTRRKHACLNPFFTPASPGTRAWPQPAVLGTVKHIAAGNRRAQAPNGGTQRRRAIPAANVAHSARPATRAAPVTAHRGVPCSWRTTMPSRVAPCRGYSTDARAACSARIGTSRARSICPHDISVLLFDLTCHA